MKHFRFALRLRCQSTSNVPFSSCLFDVCIQTQSIIISSSMGARKNSMPIKSEKFNKSIYIDTVRFTALTRRRQHSSYRM